MKKNGLRQVCLLLPSLIFASSCNGQNGAALKNTSGKAGTFLNGQLRVVKNHFFPQYPPEFLFVRGGAQDEAGNIWFATAGDGIYFYDGKSFTNFTPKDGLCHNDILCLKRDRSGTVWFGTRNGLIRYRPSGGKPGIGDFSNFLISENTIGGATHARLPYHYRPADNFVWSIMEDKTGKLWFGTNKGVYKHDPRAHLSNDMPLFTRFPDNDPVVLNRDSLCLNDVQSMLQDRRGDIWFASGYMRGEGICRYDGHVLTHFKPDGISQFRDILETKNGILLFLNAERGAYAYEPFSSPRAVAPAFTNFTKRIGIRNDTIVVMHQDRTGNLWFGLNSYNMTNGGDGGVWRYDGKSLRLFTTKDGLSHNCVFGILEDRDGNIWFGTRGTGLCRYDGHSFTDFTD